jgi:hypothetical protein
VAADDGRWLDRWRKADGEQALLPVNGREVYARQPGWSLLEERAYDYERQRAADAKASQWRGTREDLRPSATGPTAAFPAS